MSRFFRRLCLLSLTAAAGIGCLHAGTGDPQLGTDHPWYPGELAMSSFDRLFATKAAQYERVTGVKPASDHDKALASWFFRNTHYAHAEEGNEDLWGNGFSNGSQSATREYWTGLFAHGFALCGTTHAQWTAEIDACSAPAAAASPARKGTTPSRPFSPAVPMAQAAGPCSITTFPP